MGGKEIETASSRGRGRGRGRMSPHVCVIAGISESADLSTEQTAALKRFA